MLLSAILPKYEEELRPEIPLKFSEIMAISAKHRTSDIEILKNKLRHLLDVYSETSDTDDSDVDAKLYKSARQAVEERGPKLI